MVIVAGVAMLDDRNSLRDFLVCELGMRDELVRSASLIPASLQHCVVDLMRLHDEAILLALRRLGGMAGEW